MTRGATEVGFEKMRYDNILKQLHAQARQEWGDGINVTDSSPLGKFLQIIAWEISNVWDGFEHAYYQNYLLTAEGNPLDLWAGNFGESRRLGTRAVGSIRLYGDKLKRIPKGFKVSAGTDLVFQTTEDGVVGKDGFVDLPIEAMEVGSAYNVISGSIKHIVNPQIGVTRVVNHEETTMGTNIENDEELRERLLFKVRTPLTGDNKNQYEAWAKEIEGVGAVKVQRATPKAGWVTVLIGDNDGNIANKELQQEVYDYIEDVRPVNAGVIVKSLSKKPIKISVSVEVSGSIKKDQLEFEVGVALKQYLKKVKGNEVSMARVGHTIISHNSIIDYSNLVINDSKDNIHLEDTEIPVLESIDIEVK